jgi:hypothetical protein
VEPGRAEESGVRERCLERRQATLQANEEKFRSQFRSRFVDADAANQFEGSTFRKLCARRIET